MQKFFRKFVAYLRAVFTGETRSFAGRVKF